LSNKGLGCIVKGIIMTHIHTILTHRDPDMDEMEAIRLLRRYGEEKYSGITDASIQTLAKRDSMEKNAETLESEGILCVGIAGGKFDEHPFGERGRRDGECAATLVAKDIGADKHPRAKANIAYALSKNYSAETWEFEIAPLEKLAFKYLTHSGDEARDKDMEKQIFDACFLLLNAAEENEAFLTENKPSPRQASKSTDEFITEWLLTRWGTIGNLPAYIEQAKAEDRSAAVIAAKALRKSEDRVFYWILQYAKKRRVADDGKTATGFDLSDLVMYAQRHSYPEAEIQKAVFIFMDAIWHKYKNFFIDCRNDYNSPATRVATLQRGAETLLVTSVLSSNPEIAKYCRSEHGKYSAVVIKRDPQTGNTQVFFNQKYNLDPKPVAKEIRIAERTTKGMTDSLDDTALVSQGKAEGAEEWYFDGFQLLNGSNTAEEIPTKLSREEVEQAVMRGLRSIEGIA
jgi:hypothetical protein